MDRAQPYDPNDPTRGITIRLARPEDLPALTRIYNQAIEDGKTADTQPFTPAARQGWFTAHQDPRYPLYVAESDAGVLAYSTLSPYREGRPALRSTVEISYYVAREHRRRGLGTALLQHAENTARSLGFRHGYALLLDTNAGSIRLLEKLGWTCWGHFPGIAEIRGETCGQIVYGRPLVAQPTPGEP